MLDALWDRLQQAGFQHQHLERVLLAKSTGFVVSHDSGVVENGTIVPDYKPEKEWELGVVVACGGGDPSSLRRSLAGIGETIPGDRVVVVSPSANQELLRLVGEELEAQCLSLAGYEVGVACNLGAEAVEAPYLKFLTDRGWLLPGWAEEHQRVAAGEPTAILCQGLISENGTGLARIDENQACLDCLCVQRAAFLELGGFEEGIADPAADFLQRVKERGGITRSLGRVLVVCQQDT